MGTPTAPSVEEFTREATAFLEENAEKRPPARDFKWGEGSDDVGVFDEKDRAAEAADAEAAKAWRRKRYDAGLGWITGPEEYGGRELSAAHERAYQAVESRYVTPSMGVFAISLGMVAPTILAHAVQEVRDLYLRDLYRGDMVACQLFSEPGSGSDLASISTRAERDGDEWIITGQKVWTSAAHLSQIGEVICRTDPSLPKHRGMTAFVVDMTDPGVTIRPLRQMTGGANFNEVFFDEVRVNDSHRLGNVNGGWTVALTTLMNERASIGGGGAGGGAGLTTPGRIRAMLEHFGLADDKVARDEIMRIYTSFAVAKWNNQRALDKIKAGGLPGPEMSTAKLALTNNLKAYADWAANVLGPRITADSGEWGTFAFSRLLCGVPGMRVAGGTDEVMRNIVAEQVLGLPKGPGVDKNLPFSELRVGTQRDD
ncbi:MAG: acyl-CoA dehydrogenase family protein [Microthrixaceae bacterium]|nr:acyl-CoA dehydrogenase family protein [Microthrixaceae bacterium]